MTLMIPTRTAATAVRFAQCVVDWDSEGSGRSTFPLFHHVGAQDLSRCVAVCVYFVLQAPHTVT